MLVEPSAATLGATVTEIALNNLSDAEFGAIYQAWLEHAVLVFPGQSLTDDEHLEFTRRFGRLEMGFNRSQARVVGRLTNVDPEGVVASPTSLRARFLKGNTDWHSDSSYKRVGAKASLLAAHVVPTTGGETEWADMRAAFDALDDSQVAALEQKVAVHSYRFSHTPFGGIEIAGDDIVHLPDVQHPVLRTHPETGRRILFVGRHASHLIGEDQDESRAQLRQLTTEACRPPRLWKHRWSGGDLAIWDNRAVQHRALNDYQGQRRVMHRITLEGEAIGAAVPA